ncbi:hypothetical protein PtA15_4A484 [Puccinia triticina]|nr:uncharacterized protein PtA15_4A484 [Puccinia triticina]WAQ84033.1 hypothetical protein PtA15_4A484 [Puccinia triticina]WAR54874.1 hypothetical protein PtB15_4B492 [Puccinia triticina]
MKDSAAALIQNLNKLNRENFTRYVLNQVALNVDLTLPAKRNYNTNRTGPRTNKHDRLRLQPLKSILHKDFQKFFREKISNPQSIVPTDFFGNDEVNAIITYFGQIQSESDLRRIIKGKALAGQLARLMETIETFRSGPMWSGTDSGVEIPEHKQTENLLDDASRRNNTRQLESSTPAKRTRNNTTANHETKETQSEPPIHTPNEKRPRKNAVSPEVLRQQQESAAERQRMKEEKSEKQRVEKENKARRLAAQAQIMSDVKKEYGWI